MASDEDDRPDERRDAPTPDPTGAGTGAGDLEFDEAWADAGAANRAEAEPGGRDPDPVFEDPNDR
jgi:hypothetical protein